METEVMYRRLKTALEEVTYIEDGELLNILLADLKAEINDFKEEND